MEVINHINVNDGWTVVGWYRRGMINDRSLVTGQHPNDNDNDNQVDAGDAHYHVVSLIPTDRAFLDKSSPIGIVLSTKRFDVNTLLSN